jgi:hypothetical protein
MAIADPLPIIINGATKNLNKINQDSYGSEYLLRETLQEIRAKVRHSTQVKDGINYDRHNFDVTITIYATSTVPQYEEQCYIVIRRKPSQTDVDLPDAVADLLILNTDNFLLKLNTWQT